MEVPSKTKEEENTSREGYPSGRDHPGPMMIPAGIGMLFLAALLRGTVLRPDPDPDPEDLWMQKGAAFLRAILRWALLLRPGERPAGGGDVPRAPPLLGKPRKPPDGTMPHQQRATKRCSAGCGSPGAWVTPRLLSCLSFFFCVGMLAGSAAAWRVRKITEHSCYTGLISWSTTMYCSQNGLTGALLLLLPDEVFSFCVCVSVWKVQPCSRNIMLMTPGVNLTTILML